MTAGQVKLHEPLMSALVECIEGDRFGSRCPAADHERAFCLQSGNAIGDLDGLRVSCPALEDGPRVELLAVRKREALKEFTTAPFRVCG